MPQGKFSKDTPTQKIIRQVNTPIHPATDISSGSDIPIHTNGGACLAFATNPPKKKR